MREEEADRFFGRDAEVEGLIDKFRKYRIVAIVADSGTGTQKRRARNRYRRQPPCFIAGPICWPVAALMRLK
jgi:hypothetical protein